MKISITDKSSSRAFTVTTGPRPGGLLLDGRTYAVTLAPGRGCFREAVVDGKRIEFGWSEKDNTLTVILNGIDYTFEINPRPGVLKKADRLSGRSGPKTVEIRAPIPGLLTDIMVKPGDHVKKGQTVCTLDAMKLENEIATPHEGRVQSVTAKPGTPVEKDQLLMTIAS